MSAERLREAAALMRSRAAASTASPWIKRRGPGEHVYGELGGSWVADVATREDMRHIASWHPAMALAVADWLEEVAWRSEHYPKQYRAAKHALRIANAYLGDPS